MKLERLKNSTIKGFASACEITRQLLITLKAFIFEILYDFIQAGIKIRKEMLVSVLVHILLFLGLGFLIYQKTRMPEVTYTSIKVKLVRKVEEPEKVVEIPEKKEPEKIETPKKVYRRKNRVIKKRVRKETEVKKNAEKIVRKKTIPPVKNEVASSDRKDLIKQKNIESFAETDHKKVLNLQQKKSVAVQDNPSLKTVRKSDFNKRLLTDLFDDDTKLEKKQFSLSSTKLDRVNTVKVDETRNENIENKSIKRNFTMISISDSTAEVAEKKDIVLAPEHSLKKETNLTIVKPDPSVKDEISDASVIKNPVKSIEQMIDSGNTDDKEKLHIKSSDVVDFSPIIKESLTTGPYSDGLDKAPELLTGTKIQYPEWAEKKGISGKIVVKLFIKAEGKINNVQIIEQTIGQKFSAYVLQNIRKWKFNPPMKNGKAVNAWVIQTINFTLN